MILANAHVDTDVSFTDEIKHKINKNKLLIYKLRLRMCNAVSIKRDRLQIEIHRLENENKEFLNDTR